MKILHIGVIAAIFVKCATASSDDIMSQFCKAIDEENMDKAVKLHQSNSKHYQDKLNYVVDTKGQEFIFKFAEQASINNYSLLTALHRKKSPEIIEEAFKVFKFNQADLFNTSCEPELTCSPDALLNLLGKIENRKHQERAIAQGIGRLFDFGPAKCIMPLLNTLESKKSLNYLEEAAIKQAFISGSSDGNKLIVDRYYDHPAITSEYYAWGLINSGRNPARNPAFIFLLGNADMDDLIAAKKDTVYTYNPDEFKKAIEDALLIAKPSGYRMISRAPQMAKIMIGTLDDPIMGIPKVIVHLIGNYLVDELILKSVLALVEQNKASERQTNEDKAKLISAEFEDLGNMIANLQESRNNEE